MRQSKHDDLNLAEVKAVLDRLQRISRKPHAAGAQTGENDDAAVVGPTPAEGGRFSLPVRIASLIPRANASGLAKASVLIISLLAVFGAAAIFVGSDWRPASIEAPPPVAAPQIPVPASAGPAQEAEKVPAPPLQVASDLMAAGQVRAARDVLLRVTQQESADVAWLLARSYDPNYLVTLRAADAGPDVGQATRWYRTWYDIAVKQGLVADSVSLDRIIRSMNELNNR
jgi:hypothetical protein